MSLFSLSFGIFLISLFLIYFLFPKRFGQYQWVVLLIGSYVFYAFAGLKLTLFLAVSTITTYSGALLLGKCNAKFKEESKNKTPEEKKKLKQVSTDEKRLILLFVCTVNFGILLILKYADFVIENVNLLLPATWQIPAMHFLVPLGISFYTLQAVGYVIDVYRGKYEPDRNLFRYALFVSYFPQIVQGPIGRHNDLAHQLYEPHRFDYQRLKFGLQRTLWGYFKKMVIADRIAVLVSEVFGNYSQYSGFTIIFAALIYTLQVYADFSGGMDIICGISEALGIRLAENFQRPFFAKSVAEFWRRWHITLGSWMREYVFYPLAMSKPFGSLAKKLRKSFGPYVAKVLPSCLASFIVFILVGLWHGAAWKYFAYGLFQAVFVSTGTLFEPLYKKGRNRFKVDLNSKSWQLFQMVRTYLVLTVGRFIIRADSVTDAFQMLKAAFSEFNPWVFFDGSFFKLGLDAANFHLMLILIGLLFVIDSIQEKGIHIREKISGMNIAVRWTIYYIAIFAIIIFGMYGPGYNAASFIYQRY